LPKTISETLGLRNVMIVWTTLRFAFFLHYSTEIGQSFPLNTNVTYRRILAV
jgi:hypothetical protein